MSQTLNDCLQYLKDRNSQASKAEDVRQYILAANEALARFHQTRAWSFTKRKTTLAFAAPYNAGTISITADTTDLVGSATVWTAAMAGSSFAYLNLETRGYPISTFVNSIDLTLGEAYRGAASLADAPYQILQERAALPARFRSLQKPSSGTYFYRLQPILDMADLIAIRNQIHYIGEPSYYGVEFVPDASNIPQPYLWLFPAPNAAKLIDFFYHQAPPVLASGGDSLELPDDPGYWPVFRLFLNAALEELKGRPDRDTNAYNIAQDAANRLNADLRPIAETTPGRAPYLGGFNAPSNSYHAQFAPGIITP